MSSQERKQNTETKNQTKLTPEQQQILDFILKTRLSCFISGEAGSGKTLLSLQIFDSLTEVEKKKHNESLRVSSRFFKHLEKLEKNYQDCPPVVYCSTTAFSALNSPSGKTFHSWAGIGLAKGTAQEIVSSMKPNAKERWKNVSSILIDEISIMDAELFSKCHEIACTLRHNRSALWGGIQLIVIGDLYQLPAISQKDTVVQKQENFFFHSEVWNTFKMNDFVFELNQVQRQTNSEFRNFLGRVRLGTISQEDLKLINEMKKSESESESEEKNSDGDGAEPVILCSKKINAQKYNQKKLDAIDQPVFVFEKEDKVLARGLHEKMVQYITASFDENLPVQNRIEIKLGSTVMLRRNLDQKRGLVNGATGKVIGFSDDVHKSPIVQFSKDQVLTCSPVDWDYHDFNGDVLFRRIQIPICLSWACTVHQVLGLTLSRVILDIGDNNFCPRLEYVALSRTREMKDIQIKSINVRNIRRSKTLEDFYADVQSKHKKRKLSQEN